MDGIDGSILRKSLHEWPALTNFVTAMNILESIEIALSPISIPSGLVNTDSVG